MDESPKSAAEAFEALRQEVALLRKAVQQILNERQAPDYSQTLGKIMRDMKEAADGMTWLINRPAIQVPAEELASRISAAGNEAREADWETIREAARSLARATSEVDGYIARSIIASEQNRRLVQFTLRASGVGVLAGALIAIGILHLVPEHGAAWIMGQGRWEAGARLMALSNPKSWAELNEAAVVISKNRGNISACRKEATLTNTIQRCRIVIAPEGNAK